MGLCNINMILFYQYFTSTRFKKCQRHEILVEKLIAQALKSPVDEIEINSETSAKNMISLSLILPELLWFFAGFKQLNS